MFKKMTPALVIALFISLFSTASMAVPFDRSYRDFSKTWEKSSDIKTLTITKTYPKAGGYKLASITRTITFLPNKNGKFTWVNTKIKKQTYKKVHGETKLVWQKIKNKSKKGYTPSPC